MVFIDGEEEGGVVGVDAGNTTLAGLHAVEEEDDGLRRNFSIRVAKKVGKSWETIKATIKATPTTFRNTGPLFRLCTIRAVNDGDGTFPITARALAWTVKGSIAMVKRRKLEVLTVTTLPLAI